MKPILKLTALLLTGLLIQCASTDSSFQSYSDLAVPLGSEDGLRVSASASPRGETRGRLRLVKQSVVESTHADLYSGKSLTLSSLMTKVSGALGKAAHSPAGTNVYTLGSLSAGGEAQFIASGNGGLQVVYLGNSPGTVAFDASDVVGFQRLLNQALAQH